MITTVIFVHGACVRDADWWWSRMTRPLAELGTPTVAVAHTVGVDPDMIREYFLQDCDPATKDAAVTRLTRQSLTPFTQAPREIAWRSTPTSYIVCTQDLATPAATQRKRARDGVRLVEFDAGHHPFLSRPDAFAQTLTEEIIVTETATA